MIIRCKGCNGALEYSIEMGKMECAHCGNLYDVEEVSPVWQLREGEETGTSKELLEARKHATIKMQIARCTSCGAEMAVNSVEISSFCAYCGQAAVVEDRMEDCLAPDYIIPFRKSKGYAKAVIKVQLEKGAFVPKKSGISRWKESEESTYLSGCLKCNIMTGAFTDTNILQDCRITVMNFWKERQNSTI